MKRVIRKYRQLAVAIDKDIKVKKTASEWYCIPLEKTIFIPQLETELGELQDYKFLCFDGVPHFFFFFFWRFGNHTRNVYDLNWELQPWNQYTYDNSTNPIPKPENFDKMVELATTLCQGFSHVRVDLYNVEGRIYFGEMTFTNGCGFDRIIPDKYDYTLGQLWNIKP